MAAKLTRLTHKIGIELHLLAESCTIYSCYFVFLVVMVYIYWVLGFDSRQGLGIFLFTTASRTAPGPTQPPIQWIQGALSLGVKQPGRVTDHSPASSAEVKEWVEVYIHYRMDFMKTVAGEKKLLATVSCLCAWIVVMKPRMKTGERHKRTNFESCIDKNYLSSFSTESCKFVLYK
jgi:hypothetical protein